MTQIRAVTSIDDSLLAQVRQTLDDADAAVLCVAFVKQRGLYLIEDELRELHDRQGDLRLVATTALGSTTDEALAGAYHLGAQIRVLNPGSGSSYHPKLYLGTRGDRVSAVIGSANLTSGLATNIEAGVWLQGRRGEPVIDRLVEFSERLWRDPRATPWQPTKAGEAVADEVFEAELYARLRAAVAVDRVFPTLGQGKPNRVVEVTPSEIFVVTGRTRARHTPPQPVPAWMFNVAWERLRVHGTLTNHTLLNAMRVHRSSAVCAILARLPGVARAPGRHITLRWMGP